MDWMGVNPWRAFAATGSQHFSRPPAGVEDLLLLLWRVTKLLNPWCVIATYMNIPPVSGEGLCVLLRARVSCGVWRPLR